MSEEIKKSWDDGELRAVRLWHDSGKGFDQIDKDTNQPSGTLYRLVNSIQCVWQNIYDLISIEMKQQIYIGKDKWFLDDLAMLEKSGLKLKGISIKVDFLQSIDEIQNIWRYDIYNFINKKIEFLNHNIPNKYYSTLKIRML